MGFIRDTRWILAAFGLVGIYLFVMATVVGPAESQPVKPYGLYILVTAISTGETVQFEHKDRFTKEDCDAKALSSVETFEAYMLMTYGVFHGIDYTMVIDCRPAGTKPTQGALR